MTPARPAGRPGTGQQRINLGSDFYLRLMEPGDLDRVLDLERSVFSLPWSRQAFQGEIAADHARAYVLVERGESTNRAAGYICFWVVADAAHLLNLCVAPRCRRRGLAKLIVEFMTAWCRMNRLEKIELEVRSDNTPARALYRSLGFVEVGLRPGYYTDTGEAAVLMDLVLEPGPAGID